jgi:hypothetical protein
MPQRLHPSEHESQCNANENKHHAIDHTTGILSFVAVIKWWYVVPVDARETYLWGFPFACVGEGWQTSGALQFFILECMANLFIYFIFWLGILYTMHHLSIIKTPPQWLIKVLWTLSVFVMLVCGVLISCSYPTFNMKKNFEMKVMASGYKFIWQETPPFELNNNMNTKK